MREVSILRLYLLRAMYLLMAVGLGLTFWPDIIAPEVMTADSKTVVRALLGALCLLSIVGLRYPLRMLPLLLFELLWKVIWVVAFALRLWLKGGVDAYAEETFYACLMGIILVPMVIPWGYVFRHYLRESGDPWSRSRIESAARESSERLTLPLSR